MLSKAKLRPPIIARVIRSALDEVDFLAFLQRHDGLLPIGSLTGVDGAGALLLAAHAEGIDAGDFLLEDRLDGVLDLLLRGVERHAEHVLALRGERRGFFGDARSYDNGERIAHGD